LQRLERFAEKILFLLSRTSPSPWKRSIGCSPSTPASRSRSWMPYSTCPPTIPRQNSARSSCTRCPAVSTERHEQGSQTQIASRVRLRTY